MANWLPSSSCCRLTCLSSLFCITINISIAQIFMWICMIKCALYEVLRLPKYLLSLDYFYLYNNCDITFSTVFDLTHPVNFPVGGGDWKKSTTFRRALTDSFHISGQRENRTHELRGETCLLWRLRHRSPRFWALILSGLIGTVFYVAYDHVLWLRNSKEIIENWQAWERRWDANKVVSAAP
jgi:hypothetical protein